MFKDYSLLEWGRPGTGSQLWVLVPSCLLAGAHTPYLVIPAPSWGAGLEGVPSPCPLKAIIRSLPHWCGAGDTGLGPLLRGSRARSAAASPGRAAYWEPLSPRSPRPVRPSALQDPASNRVKEKGPCAGLHEPPCFLTTHTPRAAGRARSRTHRPRHKTRRQEAIEFPGCLAPHPQPSPPALQTGSHPTERRAGTGTAETAHGRRWEPAERHVSRVRKSAGGVGAWGRPSRPLHSPSPMPVGTAPRLSPLETQLSAAAHASSRCLASASYPVHPLHLATSSQGTHLPAASSCAMQNWCSVARRVAYSTHSGGGG